MEETANVYRAFVTNFVARFEREYETGDKEKACSEFKKNMAAAAMDLFEQSISKEFLEKLKQATQLASQVSAEDEQKTWQIIKDIKAILGVQTRKP